MVRSTDNPRYFSITYDTSKLSDAEKIELFDDAQALFQNGKAVSAGWETAFDDTSDLDHNVHQT